MALHELMPDKAVVWLLQFCPLHTEDIHRSFGCRTDAFRSKRSAIEFVEQSDVYVGVDVDALRASDSCDANYVHAAGKLYLFFTMLK
ncbi:MAG: hypothetical protein JSS75_04115 [Bacteroidetes bacterium]|nr:hypothetical protein [Bacteroidota bacterium]